MSDNAKEHRIHTSTPRGLKIDLNEEDILKFDNPDTFSLIFPARAQAIEICINKLGYNDHTRFIKESTAIKNCISKVAKTYNLFTHNSFE